MNRKQSVLARLLPAVALAALAWWTPHAGAAQGQDRSETCKGCHAAAFASYANTTHASKGHPRTPANAAACESCHGDATAHMQAGGGKGIGNMRTFARKTSSDDRSAVCQGCHASSRHLAFWDAGKHKKNGVACNDCHTLHGQPGPGSNIALKTSNPNIAPIQTTARKLEYETCTSCHRQIRSQLLKPSHHPIIEGRITCSDCHNPHGALTHAMLKAESVPQLCTSCHAEKRGPFIWDHPPVEENCLTCHNAHGSNHNRLMVEKAPNLCQDCHDASRHPGTVYDARGGWNPVAPQTLPNTRLIARGCVNCHFHVHGSNAPAMRGKFFLR